MPDLGVDIGGTSVKAVVLHNGAEIFKGRSDPYERPDAPTLNAAIAQALAKGPDLIVNRALCAPGVLDPAGRRITASVNVPGLVGLDLSALLGAGPAPRIVTDAHAAAYDVFASEKITGRLLAISLGTGVGACVLDNGRFLRVSRPEAGPSSGHLGQIDVSLDDHAPTGPDGGRGGLESYLGLPALKSRWGEGWPLALAQTPASEPLRALVRALRIAHAIYRPDAIFLLGGIGLALAPLATQIHARVHDRLTSLAIPNWRLGFAKDAFHAARGAARLASAADA